MASSRVSALHRVAIVACFALGVVATAAALLAPATAGAQPTPSPQATEQPATSRATHRPARASPSEGQPVHLNEASVDELCALPGIGPAKAARIVAWRQAHGGFRRIKDLRRVSGIGSKTVARLGPLLTLAPRAAAAPEPTDAVAPAGIVGWLRSLWPARATAGPED
jgi:comEA protein